MPGSELEVQRGAHSCEETPRSTGREGPKVPEVTGNNISRQDMAYLLVFAFLFVQYFGF